MVDEEVNVREILGRLDQVARVVILRDRAERQALVHAEASDPECPRLLEHGIGDALVIEEPAPVEALRSRPSVSFPGVNFQGGHLELHEVEIGLAELRRDETMGQYP